jgi:hypothetical protein
VNRQPSTLVICCGAVAREVVAMVRDNGWDHMEVTCLPAKLHNTPEVLPEGVRAKIREGRTRHENIIVLYSDCGSGGRMEAMLREEGVESIGGAHCYEVFAGPQAFSDIIGGEPGCFFVTDFLARHFEKLVFRGLGLDRFPKLRDAYFGKYKKLVYLAQTRNDELRRLAEVAAASIGLEFEMRYTGYGGFEAFLANRCAGCDDPARPCD